MIMPFTKAATYADRMNHVDDGDIKTLVEGAIWRVEVKGSGTAFTSIASFKYPTIIIDEEYKINKQHEFPLWGYAIVNKQRSGLFWIPATTKEHWKSETRFDSKMQKERTFVESPKHCVEYYGL